ncbi:hypothetical protein L916_17547 [Phytophthora nicotianae]|uniref:Uncharacterized protein n=1 Tax=Phytophthora nicotianae TaxID=4792 RepID=W2I4P0_PHYNI|nr:hypothetical protein L916_17547 [Phytophthora nicotianae]
MKPTVTLALDVETPVERLSDRIEEHHPGNTTLASQLGRRRRARKQLAEVPYPVLDHEKVIRVTIAISKEEEVLVDELLSFPDNRGRNLQIILQLGNIESGIQRKEHRFVVTMALCTTVRHNKNSPGCQPMQDIQNPRLSEGEAPTELQQERSDNLAFGQPQPTLSLHYKRKISVHTLISQEMCSMQ